MVRWGHSEGELRIRDSKKNELKIETEGWKLIENEVSIDRPTEETIAGQVKRLRLPDCAITIKRDDQPWETHFELSDNIKLSYDKYLIQSISNIMLYVEFKNQAQIRQREDRIEIRFDETTEIKLGARSYNQTPEHTITTTKQFEDLLKAIGYLSSCFKMSTPDRSYPSLRGHPPLLEIGESLDIPSKLEKPNNQIKILLPKDIRYLMVVAPLAYYVQADLIPANTENCKLIVDSDVIYSFGDFPEIQEEVKSVLRQIFYLDCLVREEGMYSTDVAEKPLLKLIDLDAKKCYNQSPGERLKTYLSKNFEVIKSEIPKWHLTHYVESSVDKVVSLPHLLHRISVIRIVSESDWSETNIFEKSIDRSNLRKVSNRKPTETNPIFPSDAKSHIVGWLADGDPIDAYKAISKAYENSLRLPFSSSEEKRIIIILNDKEMDSEIGNVTNLYKSQSDKASTQVIHKRNLTPSELANVFEEKNDFVHYVGHCSKDGFNCRNGVLDVSSISESNSEVFFLNSCNSYSQGKELIRKGSIAGAVTISDVIDSQATSVGTKFGQLLINGFGIQYALETARSQIMMDKKYLVVGDGTHSLLASNGNQSLIYDLEKQTENKFKIITHTFDISQPGGSYKSNFEYKEDPHLCGKDSYYELEYDQLLNFLENDQFPVIYQDQYYWSDKLVHELK
ncbi:MAG: hypothetical protein ABEI86_01170 [Halobacteriaceae archaeon]